MPSAVFPRNNLWLPIGVSKITVPPALKSITQSGKIQTRTKTASGRTWTEEYPSMFAGNADVEGFMAWLDWAKNEGKEFSIEHLMQPGSGLAPNGAGGGTPQVNGSSESGTSIATKGWPNSITDVVRAGDLFSIAGITKTFKFTDDASSNGSGNTTVNFSPAIYVGSEPANSAGITVSNVTINATIELINDPSITNSFWYTGMSIIFREAP